MAEAFGLLPSRVLEEAEMEDLHAWALMQTFADAQNKRTAH